MLKTIVIAVCCAVAYLAIVIGLTVYCSIRLMRAKNLRKMHRPAAAAELTPAGTGLFCSVLYDTRCYFNVRSKADISQLNLPHGTDN